MIEDLLRRADRIQAPDIWPEIDSGPTRELPRRMGSRVLTAAAAVAVGVVGVAVAVSVFLGGDMTMIDRGSPPNPDMVSLGGLELDRALLEGPPGNAQRADTPAAEALRHLIAHPKGIEPLPEKGWRVLQESADSVVFASDQSPIFTTGWVIVTVEEEDGEWGFAGSSYGVVPGPTVAQRGFRLSLEWSREEFVARPGEEPELAIRLVNGRDEAWIDDGGEYVVTGRLLDMETGTPVATYEGGYAIQGVGRSYRLAPGESVELRVALNLDPDRLQPGVYEISAAVKALGLRAPPATLRVE